MFWLNFRQFLSKCAKLKVLPLKFAELKGGILVKGIDRFLSKKRDSAQLEFVIKSHGS